MALGATLHAADSNARPLSPGASNRAQSNAAPARPLFQSIQEERDLFTYQKKDHTWYGRAEERARFITNKPGDDMGPSILQRSGRGRLGDHNLLLAALFKGRLLHRRDGNFSNLFEQSTFVDIGSAILTGDGAPTCRDLWEDANVRPHLKALIATDINDADSRYIDQYLAGTNRLPFPVKEVPLALVETNQFAALVDDASSPLIFRSANSGPDLYYESPVLSNHLRGLLDYAGRRPLLYFFSVFVLYKGTNDSAFTMAGSVDRQVGFNHRGPAWTNVVWSRRDIADTKVFYPYGHLKVLAAPK